MVRKSLVHEVMSNMSRLIEGKIDTLEVEYYLRALLRLKMNMYQKLRLKSLIK